MKCNCCWTPENHRSRSEMEGDVGLATRRALVGLEHAPRE